MKIACDADGLIKLNRAGILALAAERFDLLVGPEVFREVVIEGKERGYSDALAIERIIKKPVSMKTAKRKPKKILDENELGAGEQETLELYKKMKAAVILSDDRRFLRELEDLKIPFITPAAMIVVLAEKNSLKRAAAIAALKRLEPHIRQDQYKAALGDLQAMRKEKR